MLAANLEQLVAQGGGFEMIKFEVGEAFHFVGRLPMVMRRTAFHALVFAAVASTLSTGVHSEEPASHSATTNTPTGGDLAEIVVTADRKSTRLNSSHLGISYA